MFNKDTDICQLKGVGTKSEYFYRKLGINTVRNLLSHIPFRYQDSSNIISINVFKELKEGTFLGEIEEVKTTYFRKKITTVKVKDDSGSVRLVFFNQAYLQKTFKKNEVYIFDAKITEKNGRKNIYNPKYEKFKLDKKNQFHVGKIVGVYPETKGLSSAILRRRISQLKDDIPNIFEDPLHPYTMTLLSAVPVLGKRTMDAVVLSDEVPSAPSEDFTGCVFAHRCGGHSVRCLNETPVLREHESGHFVACWRSEM